MKYLKYYIPLIGFILALIDADNYSKIYDIDEEAKIIKHSCLGMIVTVLFLATIKSFQQWTTPTKCANTLSPLLRSA